jgi:hypothetical protein
MNTLKLLTKLLLVLSTVLFVVAAAVFFHAALAAKTANPESVDPKSSGQSIPDRTIHFPQVSVGNLFLMKDLDDRGVVKGKPFSAARGLVKVPGNKFLLFDVSYDGVQNLDWLKELKPDDIQALWVLRADLSESDCKKLSLLHGVKALDMRETDVAGKGFQYMIEGMPALEQLELSRTSVTDDAFPSITRLKHLKRLVMGSTEVTNSGITQLSGLTELEHLELSKTRITDKGLIPVAKMQNLSVLNLSDDNIGDEGIVYVSKLPRLTVLHLTRSKMTDETLKSLAKMRTLSRLSINGTKITNQGIKNLASGHLGDIDLASTHINDGCVPSLCKLPLLHLNVTDTQITPDGIAQIQIAKKGCEILHGKSEAIAPP